MPVLVTSATESKVLIDGEEQTYIQSIDFQVGRKQVDVISIGLGERQSVIETGQLTVTGTLRYHGVSTTLNEILASDVPLSFNMVVELSKAGSGVRKLTFDECFLDSMDFNMDAGELGISIYKFTATRLREE